MVFPLDLGPKLPHDSFELFIFIQKSLQFAFQISSQLRFYCSICGYRVDLCGMLCFGNIR